MTHKKSGAFWKNSIDNNDGDGQNPSNTLPNPMTPQCKHPIVKVVAREDDIEFVECQNCGEVFDSAEYNDMALEEEETAVEASED